MAERKQKKLRLLTEAQEAKVVVAALARTVNNKDAAVTDEELARIMTWANRTLVNHAILTLVFTGFIIPASPAPEQMSYTLAPAYLNPEQAHWLMEQLAKIPDPDVASYGVKRVEPEDVVGEREMS